MDNTEDNKLKNIFEIVKNGGISAVLIAIIFYFGGAYLTKLETIEKQVVEIKIQLTKMQMQIVDRQTVENIVDGKIKIYHK